MIFEKIQSRGLKKEFCALHSDKPTWEVLSSVPLISVDQEKIHALGNSRRFV